MDLLTTSFDPNKIPALTPPAGIVPNFIDADTRGPLVRSITCVTFALMLVFVILRVYTRLRITGSFGPDDYLCVAAAASVLAYSGIILSTVTDTLGRHQWNVPITAIDLKYVTGSLVSVILYSIAATFVKTTLLVFYLRIFRPNYHARVLAWTGIVVIVLFYLITIIVLLANCIPLESQVPGPDPSKWEEKKNNRCGQPNLDISAAQGVFSAVTDLYVLIIPISSVLALQLQNKRKLGVLAIFMTGLLSCACSSASAYYRFVSQKSGKGDYTWDNGLPYVLGTVELNVGIICSCLPITFVVFKSFSIRGPWTSFIRYIRTRSRARHDSGSDPLARDSSSYLAKETDNSALPTIPRATMTGLRTFIGRANSHASAKPREGKNIVIRTELTTLNEPGSVDYTPHHQLEHNQVGSHHAGHFDPAYVYYPQVQHFGDGRMV